MERLSSRRLVILLAFFHLIVSSSASPSTRNQRMPQDTLDLEAFNRTLQRKFAEDTTEEVLSGKMELERIDYAGSGANDRHTPKPPGRKLK